MGNRAAGWQKLVAGLVLAALGAGAAANQWLYNVRPSLEGRDAILAALARSDEQRYRDFLGPAGPVIDQINSLPADAVLYFVPNFPTTAGDAENVLWWWHLNHILRYFCFPRRILVVHFDLYHNDSREYRERFLGPRGRLADAEFLKSRGVTHIIVYRHDRLLVLPVGVPFEV